MKCLETLAQLVVSQLEADAILYGWPRLPRAGDLLIKLVVSMGPPETRLSQRFTELSKGFCDY